MHWAENSNVFLLVEWLTQGFSADSQDIFLMQNRGVVVSRDTLLDRVWGMEYAGGSRTVDVHVAQLRSKLGRPDLIRTIRGSGYKAVQP